MRAKKITVVFEIEDEERLMRNEGVEFTDTVSAVYNAFWQSRDFGLEIVEISAEYTAVTQQKSKLFGEGK